MIGMSSVVCKQEVGVAHVLKSVKLTVNNTSVIPGLQFVVKKRCKFIAHGHVG